MDDWSERAGNFIGDTGGLQVGRSAFWKLAGQWYSTQPLIPRRTAAMALDTVFIEDLRIETVIGIYDWEREIRQVVSLDLEMASDNKVPAGTDSIDDALNYKAVAKRLIQYVGESQFQLVETLAERVAEIVLKEFGVPWLRLKLSKPGAVTGSRAVGVIIERGSRA